MLKDSPVTPSTSSKLTKPSVSSSSARFHRLKIALKLITELNDLVRTGGTNRQLYQQSNQAYEHFQQNIQITAPQIVSTGKEDTQSLSHIRTIATTAQLENPIIPRPKTPPPPPPPVVQAPPPTPTPAPATPPSTPQPKKKGKKRSKMQEASPAPAPLPSPREVIFNPAPVVPSLPPPPPLPPRLLPAVKLPPPAKGYSESSLIFNTLCT